MQLRVARTALACAALSAPASAEDFNVRPVLFPDKALVEAFASALPRKAVVPATLGDRPDQTVRQLARAECDRNDEHYLAIVKSLNGFDDIALDAAPASHGHILQLPACPKARTLENHRHKVQPKETYGFIKAQYTGAAGTDTEIAHYFGIASAKATGVPDRPDLVIPYLTQPTIVSKDQAEAISLKAPERTTLQTPIIGRVTSPSYSPAG
jgi:hypothetical protein